MKESKRNFKYWANVTPITFKSIYLFQYIKCKNSGVLKGVLTEILMWIMGAHEVYWKGHMQIVTRSSLSAGPYITEAYIPKGAIATCSQINL